MRITVPSWTYIALLFFVAACGGDDVPPFVAADARSAADAAVTDALTSDASTDPVPAIRLSDVTASVGELAGGARSDDYWGVGSGAAVGDLNGDGRPDIVLARCDQGDGGPVTLLAHSDAGAWDFTASPGFSARFAGRCAHAVALGDYDNDGDLDVFIGIDGRDVLLRNNGAASFSDATMAAGVAGPDGDVTSGAVFADVNGDGLLDLYVLAHTPLMMPTSDPLNANRLYLNNGNGSFRLLASTVVAGDGSSQAALIADLDNDGDLDIYVANDTFAVDEMLGYKTLQPDALLAAQSRDDSGAPSYVDRAASFGLAVRRSSMGVALTDLDGDGRDELYVTDYGPNHLHMWQADAGRYYDRAAAWAAARGRNAHQEYNVSWGARFVDFDRNGRVELLIANGQVSRAINCSGWSQLDLYLRRDGDRFTDVTAGVGWPSSTDCPPTDTLPLASRAVVLGDLDGDGDDDVIVTPWDESYRFYRNDTDQTDRHRVRVRAIGTVAAPDPVGLVMDVRTVDGTSLRRTLYSGGDTYSQSDRVLEAGLRGDGGVTSVWLHWPSGYDQRIDGRNDFALDTTLTITEPAWLTLSARATSSSDPVPVMTYRPVDQTGLFLGAAGAGKSVTATRSDGVPVSFVDHGDGSYTAALPHPGSARITVIRVQVDGAPVAAALTVNYEP